MGSSQPGYRSLLVWQQALDLASDVLAIVAEFPNKTGFVLRDQMQRSAISVPSNIAEGSGRGTKKDFIAFLRIAAGSLRELETQLDLALLSKVLHQDDHARLMAKCDSVGRMLTRLIQSQQPPTKG